MIIGHEITHGFDDQGRHMDADGNRKNWWGNSTSENFAENAECMIDQYDKQTFMGMNLSGRLTLGENIADNGGVKIAYNAWVFFWSVKLFFIYSRNDKQRRKRDYREWKSFHLNKCFSSQRPMLGAPNRSKKVDFFQIY